MCVYMYVCKKEKKRGREERMEREMILGINTNMTQKGINTQS